MEFQKAVRIHLKNTLSSKKRKKDGGPNVIVKGFCFVCFDTTVPSSDIQQGATP